MRDVRIDLAQPLGRGGELGAPDVGRAEEDLAVEIRLVDDVEVDEADRADPGRGQVQSERRAEPSGAHDEHARRLEPLLALGTDLRQDEMARVAPDLLVRQVRKRGRGHRVHSTFGSGL